VIKRWKASTSSYVFVLLPFVTIAASTLLDNEKLSPALISGGALVLLGVYVGALSKAGETVRVRADGHEGDTLAIEPLESSD